MAVDNDISDSFHGVLARCSFGTLQRIMLANTIPSSVKQSVDTGRCVLWCSSSTSAVLIVLGGAYGKQCCVNELLYRVSG